MKRALITAGLVVAGLIAPAPAIASRPGVTPTSACVSGWEFGQLRDGMSRQDVEALLDGPGRPHPRYSRRMAEYRPCASPTWRQGRTIVEYRHGAFYDAAEIIVDEGWLE